MAASTLEFNNSTTRTIINEEINNAFSRLVVGNKKAIGVELIHEPELHSQV